MAMNPKDLELPNGQRQPRNCRGESGQLQGEAWHARERDRRFTHQALAAVLNMLAKPPVKL